MAAGRAIIGSMESTTKPLTRPDAARTVHVPRTEAAARASYRLPPLLVAMRPRQWLKNGLVFLALLFSVNEWWHPSDISSWAPLLGSTILAFIAFTCVASAEYLVNDLRDIESDRLHPRKRRRPLAAGTLSARTATIAAVALFAVGALLGLALGLPFFAILVVYALQSLAYSYWLKHIVIIDVLVNAIGFVLRAIGGALAIDVPVSPWLYSVTLLGALFVAIYKRRNELILLEAGATEHRPILAEYTTHLLDQMASVVTASTVIAYSLYTFTAPNLPKNHAMMATVPFVLYGIFRYMYLVHRRGEGGSPEELIIRDKPLLVDLALWMATSGAILLIYR
jgi:4-hydroxybenzoate polyprenyltransferase